MEKQSFTNRFKQTAAEIGLGALYDWGGYQYAKEQYGPDTVGMADLAHEKPKNPDYAKDAAEINSFEDIENHADRKYLETKLTDQYRDYGYDIRTIKGHHFKAYSAPSQRIAQDKDFLNAIKTQKDAILRNDKASGEFPRYKDWKASNLHYAIGHYDLRNGYLDNRGNLHIQIFDTYDFNKTNHTPLNQAGRNQMMKGNLKPYFTIHDIIVPNYVIRDLWK